MPSSQLVVCLPVIFTPSKGQDPFGYPGFLRMPTPEVLMMPPKPALQICWNDIDMRIVRVSTR